MKKSEKTDEWVRDGHHLCWGEDGETWVEHPDHCPFVDKEFTSEITEKVYNYRDYECIVGIEDIEVGLDEENYEGRLFEMPWEDSYMPDGRMLIEWRYDAYWVDGLPNGDEYHTEFEWREANNEGD